MDSGLNMDSLYNDDFKIPQFSALQASPKSQAINVFGH